MNRIGFGFDSHRFVKGRALKLGGVEVKYDRGLGGHSDGDAAMHALIDAMFGPAGVGDIGEHFPDTEEKWKNADGTALLTEALNIVLLMGWAPVNCDLTIVTEKPNLSEYKQTMREKIADLLGLDFTAVSIKAKTAEGMGPIGAGEGLAVFAAVLMEEMEL